MKVFVVTLGLAVLLCCLFSSSEAGLERQKRGVGIEKCPKNKTLEECEAYAKERSRKVCEWSKVDGVPPQITWVSCAGVACGPNSKKIAPDVSKSYPKCCGGCERKDDSKPAEISAVE